MWLFLQHVHGFLKTQFQRMGQLQKFLQIWTFAFWKMGFRTDNCALEQSLNMRHYNDPDWHSGIQMSQLGSKWTLYSIAFVDGPAVTFWHRNSAKLLPSALMTMCHVYYTVTCDSEPTIIYEIGFWLSWFMLFSKFHSSEWEVHGHDSISDIHSFPWQFL